MKTIKKEIDVPACEICGKEISQMVVPHKIEVKEGKYPQIAGNENFYFHQECVEKLLIEKAIKLSNPQ